MNASKWQADNERKGRTMAERWRGVKPADGGQ